jgi:hypothetical protein
LNDFDLYSVVVSFDPFVLLVIMSFTFWYVQ